MAHWLVFNLIFTFNDSVWFRLDYTTFHLIEEVDMGFRNFGSLLMVFLILMMVFGTQRLRDVGNDLAVAIRSFRKGMQDDLDDKEKKEPIEGAK